MSKNAYNDGQAGLKITPVLNLNNGFRYSSGGGSIDGSSNLEVHLNEDGIHLGSSRVGGARSASFTMTYDVTDHALITDQHCLRTGHLVQWRDGYWIIDEPKGRNEARQAIQVSVSATEAVNPIIDNLLSYEGQIKRATKTVGSAYSLQCTSLNTRAGATLTWSLEGAPSGMTIGASTGLIAWATPVVGAYKVIVKLLDESADTLADDPDHQGEGELWLTVSA